MKPIACLFLLTGSFLAFAQGPTPTPTPLPATSHIPSPLYPLKIGNRWTYRVYDKKSPQPKLDPVRKVVVTVEREEIYTEKSLVASTGKVETQRYLGYILKSASGNNTTLDHVVIMNQGLFKVHTAGTPLTPPLLFLKLDLKKDITSWDWHSTSGNTTVKGTFNISSTIVSVPIFKEPVAALLVAYRDHQPKEKLVEIDYWFVPGYGMVKQRVRERNHEIELELEKYEAAK